METNEVAGEEGIVLYAGVGQGTVNLTDFNNTVNVAGGPAGLPLGEHRRPARPIDGIVKVREVGVTRRGKCQPDVESMIPKNVVKNVKGREKIFPKSTTA